MRFLIPLLATLALAACRPQPSDESWETSPTKLEKDREALFKDLVKEIEYESSLIQGSTPRHVQEIFAVFILNYLWGGFRIKNVNRLLERMKKEFPEEFRKMEVQSEQEDERRSKVKDETSTTTTSLKVTEEDKDAQFKALMNEIDSESDLIEKSILKGANEMIQGFLMHYAFDDSQKELIKAQTDILQLASRAESQIAHGLRMSNEEARKAVRELDADLKTELNMEHLLHSASQGLGDSDTLMQLFVKWYKRFGSMTNRGKQALAENFPELASMSRDEHSQTAMRLLLRACTEFPEQMREKYRANSTKPKQENIDLIKKFKDESEWEELSRIFVRAMGALQADVMFSPTEHRKSG